MAKTESIDQAVMKLLKKVQQKKEEIEAAKKKPRWKTNCSIAFNPDSEVHDRINLQVQSARKLIDLYAFLDQMEGHLERAARELGLEVDLTYMAYSISDWKDDLKTRAAQVSVKQKEQEMAALDARVSKLVSPDQRREMELRALQELLGDE